MERAIEKAIEGGLDVAKALTNLGYEDCITISYYDLIFGTNFIECLVGEGEIKHMCFDEPTDPSECCFGDKDYKEWDCTYIDKNKTNIGCKSYEEYYRKDASYHRAQMANIKDVEKLKEYVEGLI